MLRIHDLGRRAADGHNAGRNLADLIADADADAAVLAVMMRVFTACDTLLT
ncbi:hypothetical protein [Rhodococcus erythropolis]|uniref:hypothetical protein n=1 Tax=Rhodococcus erythropolis TaxID=1833 RepID=UPI000B0089EC|nr:hypothetical protein [Rhodococcus erythropolis]